ncbi:phosphomannomutase [Aestuariivirga sp.]|uniref:phosphomannomutase n=1 Tax=Aestuariivirga sp. TaxID=2650926 RepID=UPI003918F1F1
MSVRDKAATASTLGEMAARAGAGFGTSGVRGRVADLTPALCHAYAQAFLSIVEPRRGRVLIGQDLRPSSPGIAAACAAAAQEARIEVVNAGVLPTPALAFAAQSLGLPAIMVTGSHIPFDRNGIKFYHAHGEITKEDEQKILSFTPPHFGPPPACDLPEPDPGPLALYLARYRSAFGKKALEGFRIGVYEHSSAARDLLHRLLKDLGAETVSLGRSDDFVPIDTEAVRPEDREAAPRWCRAHALDAVVTTDGDADRPLVADEKGTWLRGDVLGLICALELGARTVVTPVSSNTALERCGAVQQVIRTRIGSPHVIAGMDEARLHPVVGYEANGGLLLGSTVTLAGGTLAPLRTRDAILPVLLLLSRARRTGSSVSALLEDIDRHTASDRLQGVEPERCQHVIALADTDAPTVVALLTGGAGAWRTIDRTDGVRVTLESGDIVHIRLSGNAPELRCYTESWSQAQAEDLCRTCLARLAPRVLADSAR